jgi:hypothetical protein
MKTTKMSRRKFLQAAQAAALLPATRILGGQ